MTTGTLIELLSSYPYGTPCMIGHRFLCDIHSVGTDILTMPELVAVIESEGVGVSRIQNDSITRAPEAPMHGVWKARLAKGMKAAGTLLRTKK